MPRRTPPRGVGTTVAAIRAGLPQVVVSIGFDPPDTVAHAKRWRIGRQPSHRPICPRAGATGPLTNVATACHDGICAGLDAAV